MGLLLDVVNAVERKVVKRNGIFAYHWMRHLGRKRPEFVYKFGDYVRAGSLELIANEIYDNRIAGKVAELGVFKGEFARLINMAFPDRELFLFDTFEGFDKRDVDVDRNNKYSIGDQDFSQTSVDFVLAQMPNKQNCVVRKGFFPETAQGLNERFAFVSLDCDLYDPIYKGLSYFYDRLNPGGYILIHDYNNTRYSGAKAAVKKFCEENALPFFPLCDNQGSAAIMRPRVGNPDTGN